jgi:hypothetical protein
MIDRKTLLSGLDVGDIFHAEAPNGASLICLVLSLNSTTIRSRRITSGDELEFDRQTGLEKAGEGEPAAVIDSVAPLPPDHHNAFLGLDRRYRQISPNWDESDFERAKLTEAEKKALIFIHSHYASNPLPSV